jgi:hypothetical protein
MDTWKGFRSREDFRPDPFVCLSSALSALPNLPNRLNPFDPDDDDPNLNAEASDFWVSEKAWLSDLLTQ